MTDFSYLAHPTNVQDPEIDSSLPGQSLSPLDDPNLPITHGKEKHTFVTYHPIQNCT